MGHKVTNGIAVPLKGISMEKKPLNRAQRVKAANEAKKRKNHLKTIGRSKEVGFSDNPAALTGKGVTVPNKGKKNGTRAGTRPIGNYDGLPSAKRTKAGVVSFSATKNTDKGNDTVDHKGLNMPLSDTPKQEKPLPVTLDQLLVRKGSPVIDGLSHKEQLVVDLLWEEFGPRRRALTVKDTDLMKEVGVCGLYEKTRAVIAQEAKKSRPLRSVKIQGTQPTGLTLGRT